MNLRKDDRAYWVFLVWALRSFAAFSLSLQSSMDGSLGIMQLKHRYAGLEGSSLWHKGKGISDAHWERLRRHDQSRRGRFLADGVVFSLGCHSDPTTAGLYFTEVRLGSPSKSYIVQVDTGSDVLWVNCLPCSGCPRKSELGISLTLYDPNASSSKAQVSCSDPLCKTGTQVTEASCSNNSCGYLFQYGDGSTSEGYYLKDVLHYQSVGTGNSLVNSTSTILFGCSINQTGDLTTSDQAVDGIMGFGQLDLSVPSQLAAQGKAPKVFAHCLEGEAQGGGILVIGDISEPKIVYTPLVPNSTHYNVNLRSISVGGKDLSISPSEFTSTDTSGVIIDSGTTLAYLPEDAYISFVNAITDAYTQESNLQPISNQSTLCFEVEKSLDQLFPKVTLQFEDAAMELSPEDYLLQGHSGRAGRSYWCIGWQSSSSSSGSKDENKLTILGDIVLKNKLVVYDLENSRIGWVNYNCSSSISLAGQHSVRASHLDMNGADRHKGLLAIAVGLLSAIFFHVCNLIIL